MKLDRQRWIIGETIVMALFIVVAGLAGAHLTSFIGLEKWAQVWVGRILLSFTGLAFIYITYKANSSRGQ